MRDIADSNASVMVHERWFQHALPQHVDKYCSLYGKLKKYKDHPDSAQPIARWLSKIRTYLLKRHGQTENNTEEVKRSHARFHSRMSTYPPHGRYDGALLLIDRNFFNDLVKLLEKLEIPNPKEAAKEKMKYFECCATQKPSDKPVKGSFPKDSKSPEFLIPVLLVEHKRKDTDQIARPKESDGRNQRLMYTTSAARFLYEMEIYNYPVFGLTTAGNFASFSVAWYSFNEVCKGGSILCSITEHHEMMPLAGTHRADSTSDPDRGQTPLRSAEGGRHTTLHSAPTQDTRL